MKKLFAIFVLMGVVLEINASDRKKSPAISELIMSPSDSLRIKQKQRTGNLLKSALGSENSSDLPQYDPSLVEELSKESRTSDSRMDDLDAVAAAYEAVTEEKEEHDKKNANRALVAQTSAAVEIQWVALQCQPRGDIAELRKGMAPSLSASPNLHATSPDFDDKS